MRLIKIYNIKFNDGTEATYYLQSVNSAEDLFEKLKKDTTKQVFCWTETTLLECNECGMYNTHHKSRFDNHMRTGIQSYCKDCYAKNIDYLNKIIKEEEE